MAFLRHLGTSTFVATLALVASGCGSSPPPAAAPTDSTPTAGRDAPTTPRPKPVADTGPGRLLARPLVYRDLEPSGSGPQQYVVIFRVRRPFAGRNPSYATQAGAVALDDESVNKDDGYQGALGRGTPKGKCYVWRLAGSAELDAVNARQAIPFRLSLNNTSGQQGQTTLRPYPTRARLATDLQQIGCSLPAPAAVTVLGTFGSGQRAEPSRPLTGEP